MHDTYNEYNNNHPIVAEVQFQGSRKKYKYEFSKLENLPDIDKKELDTSEFPIERLPSVADKISTPTDELVWLTPSAATDRLEVALHMVPELKTTTFQKLISSLEKNGYQFARGKNGNVVMLVDPTVPFKDNTDGEYHHDPQPEKLASEGRMGIRPLRQESDHYIAIPLDEIFERRQKTPPLEKHYFGGKASYHRSEYIKAYLLQLANNEKYATRVTRIVNANADVNPITEKEALRRHLFELLTELGARARPLHKGPFPYEPAFLFSGNIELAINQSDEPGDDVINFYNTYKNGKQGKIIYPNNFLQTLSDNLETEQIRGDIHLLGTNDEEQINRLLAEKGKKPLKHYFFPFRLTLNEILDLFDKDNM